MDKRIVTLLKEINDGKFSGSQRKLAKLLGVSDTSVSTWCRKEKKPSLDMISNMAKIFNKSEEELDKIFNEEIKDESFKDKEIIKKLTKENKLLKEKIKFLEEQVSFYKEKATTNN